MSGQLALGTDMQSVYGLLLRVASRLDTAKQVLNWRLHVFLEYQQIQNVGKHSTQSNGLQVATCPVPGVPMQTGCSSQPNADWHPAGAVEQQCAAMLAPVQLQNTVNI
jgi:hypothetical protein